MGATHGRKTCIVVNESDLSRFFTDADISGEAEIIEVTTFTATAKQYIVGYADGKASLKGLFGSKDPAIATDPKETDDVLQPLLGDETTNQFIVVAQEGLSTVGLNASFFQAKSTKYSVTSPYNGVVSVMSELAAHNGSNLGPVLAQNISRTTTGQAAAHDTGAATTKGFVAQLHRTAVGATTTVSVVIEDSADGATGWATIGTFTTSGAAGAERIEVAGNVRRYVRARWTFTGINGATFIVVFALQK